MAKPAIDLEADIQPVSEFRANASGALQHVRETGRAIVLTQRGRSAAVLLGVRTYQALLDELDELRDVHQGIADAKAGRVVSHAEARDRLLERHRK